MHHILDRLTTALIAFGPAGVFVVAILDSAGIPMPAVLDALLFGVAWKSPNLGWLTAGLATVGSLAGNLALFLAARTGGRRWIKLPPPDKPQKFRRWFQRFGLVTVFIPAVVPFIPLPLKIFVVSAGVLHTSFPHFLAVIFVARVVRYFGEAWLGMKMGEEGATTFLRGHAWTMVAAAAGMAVVFFVLIRLNDRRRQAA